MKLPAIRTLVAHERGEGGNANWQNHSIRGSISGTISKKIGLAIKSAKAHEGERILSDRLQRQWAALKMGYHSCNSRRKRHRPKCQNQARQRWIAARQRELLTTRYFHVLFRPPHELQTLGLPKASPPYRSCPTPLKFLCSVTFAGSARPPILKGGAKCFLKIAPQTLHTPSEMSAAPITARS